MTIELGRPVATVTVEGQPPSGNHMYEGYGNNRRKRAAVIGYQREVTFWVRQAMAAGFKPGKRIVINFYFNLGRDIDCTNAIKVIEDGIGEALCPGIDPPRCCRAYDTRFLPRAMDKTIRNKKPSVTFELVNA